MTTKEQYKPWKSYSPGRSGGYLSEYDSTIAISRILRVFVFLAMFSSCRQEVIFFTPAFLGEGNAKGQIDRFGTCLQLF
jgi:hypothetical protein